MLYNIHLIKALFWHYKYVDTFSLFISVEDDNDTIIRDSVVWRVLINYEYVVLSYSFRSISS